MIGRRERIRTFDPLHPMQVRYQAAPHAVGAKYISVARPQTSSGDPGRRAVLFADRKSVV